MDFLIALLFLACGTIGVFYPSFLYKKELLTAQQIERNNRIWKWGGSSLIMLSFILLAMKLFWKE
jgi:hypothetical protein